tara:strand:+ start:86120 stop:86506 length:387 start_codon:yes stop_codon:yes gene_type:complete
MAELKGVVISPTGKEHALPSLEDAVRTLVIVSDELQKEDYDNILKGLKRNPRSNYQYKGWTVAVDYTARRAGIGVVVTSLSTNEPRYFSSIKECAGVMGIKEARVRTLINGFSNTHEGFRYRKQNVGW